MLSFFLKKSIFRFISILLPIIFPFTAIPLSKNPALKFPFSFLFSSEKFALYLKGAVKSIMIRVAITRNMTAIIFPPIQ